MGAHGPVVLATGVWLIWHERALLQGSRPSGALISATVILLAAPCYYAGRVTQVLLVEGLALFAILIATAALYVSWHKVRLFWFHIVYLLFILSPPENWIFVATRPIKSALASSAVELMSSFGISIAGSASMILVDGYQMQVAAACSGVNSLLGLTAIGLFYVYLRHGNQPRYAALLILLVVPIAILTNFVRVVGLVLTIHWVGDGSFFHFLHDIGGLIMFAVALVLLFALDSLICPVATRWSLIR